MAETLDWRSAADALGVSREGALSVSSWILVLQVVRSVRLLRVTRLLQLTEAFPSLQSAQRVFQRTATSILWMLAFIFSVMFIFALTGLHVFSGTLDDKV